MMYSSFPNLNYVHQPNFHQHLWYKYVEIFVIYYSSYNSKFTVDEKRQKNFHYIKKKQSYNIVQKMRVVRFFLVTEHFVDIHQQL